jgi:hypothetical protein
MRQLLALCFILIFTASAYAYFPFPALTGPSGLVRIPDAYVLPYKNWNISSDFGTEWQTEGAASEDPIFYYKANLGTFRNFELGLVGGLDQQGTQVREGVFVNMKYAPNSGYGDDPLLLAIGVENLSARNDTGVYMVATKPFIQGPKLSFGFLADFPDGRFRPFGMAGIMVPTGNVAFLGDFLAGEEIFELNCGIRFNIIPSFAVEGKGINILGDVRAKDPKSILVGMSWANPF